MELAPAIRVISSSRFSTANAHLSEKRVNEGMIPSLDHLPNDALTPLFEATIDATEEAIVNAMVAAEGAEGANTLYIPRLPHNRVQALLSERNLLETDFIGLNHGVAPK